MIKGAVFSHEMEFLLCSVRYYLGTATTGELKHEAAKVTDWQHFLKLCRSHKLVFVVQAIIKAYPALFPEGVRKDINQSHLNNVTHMMKLSRELILIKQLFDEHQIRFTSLKGPLLAEKVYGNHSNSRKSVDLDIVVDKKDFSKADALLKKQGYRIAYEGLDSKKKERQFKELKFKTSHHIAYHHPQKNTKIEIHWMLLKFSYVSENENTTRELHNQQIRTLNRETEFVYLCNHGYKHLWAALLWLLDVAKLSSNGLPDAGLIAKLARETDSERAVMSALMLSDELFKTKLQKHFRQHFKQNKRIRKITENMLLMLKMNEQALHMRQSGLRTTIKRLLIETHANVFMHKRLKHKFHYLNARIINQSTWEYIPLPSRLYFLYYLIFPFMAIPAIAKRFKG